MWPTGLESEKLNIFVYKVVKLMENSKSTFMSIAILLGLLGSGFFVYKGMREFRSTQTVKVKGIGEEIVKADRVIWTIAFNVEEPKIEDATKKFNDDKNVILSFLQENKIKKEDIKILTPSVRTESNEKEKKYVIMGKMVVHSTQVDLVQEVSAKVFQLLDRNVLLSGDYYGGENNPAYIISDFDALRPAIFQKALESSKIMANVVASKMGRTVEEPMDIDQGTFNVGGMHGQSEQASIQKKIRVVSFVQYKIK